MQNYDTKKAEEVLMTLDKSSDLFPEFALKTENGKPVLLGRGSSSLVYEMYNKKRPDRSYCLKVSGFFGRVMDSDEFSRVAGLQYSMSHETQYIVRILGYKEVDLGSDENQSILQLVLMEKLIPVITKDRYGNKSLFNDDLKTYPEVRKFAVEIGQALLAAHNNNNLHRDIKLENIFYDPDENVYKLGDFGAAKYTEDGNAETIIYTDGYEAPEIKDSLNDVYNKTADIYSFGITLYLLLNDLNFPFSKNYHPDFYMQYDPDNVFPAPVSSPPVMTRIIRKMCAYYPDDRYQSVGDVLLEIESAAETDEKEESEREDFSTLSDDVTMTFHDESHAAGDGKRERREDTRAKRMADQKYIDFLYGRDSVRYFFAITIIMFLLFKGMQPDTGEMPDANLVILPAAALVEAIFQRLNRLDLPGRACLIALAISSAFATGLKISHILLIVFAMIGMPVLTAAAGVSMAIWTIIAYTGKLKFLEFLYGMDLGWVFLLLLVIIINRYLNMRVEWEKASSGQIDFLDVWFYKICFFIAAAGGIFFLLDRYDVMNMPELISRLHLFRVGIISSPLSYLLKKYDLKRWNSDYGESTEGDD